MKEKPNSGVICPTGVMGFARYPSIPLPVIHALLVLLVNGLEHVVHGLGRVHTVALLLSPPKTQVQTELKGVVVVSTAQNPATINGHMAIKAIAQK